MKIFTINHQTVQSSLDVMLLYLYTYLNYASPPKRLPKGATLKDHRGSMCSDILHESFVLNKNIEMRWLIFFVEMSRNLDRKTPDSPGSHLCESRVTNLIELGVYNTG